MGMSLYFFNVSLAHFMVSRHEKPSLLVTQLDNRGVFGEYRLDKV